MIVIDTNILLYAANRDYEDHGKCRAYLEDLRLRSTPSYLSWNICYEFIRLCSHSRVFRSPWSSGQAWGFIDALLKGPGFGVLTATDRHPAVLAETLEELPDIRGNLVHDIHTAVLMREHGISRICTRDSDFHRFPFLEVVDPVRR